MATPDLKFTNYIGRPVELNSSANNGFSGLLLTTEEDGRKLKNIYIDTNYVNM